MMSPDEGAATRETDIHIHSTLYGISLSKSLGAAADTILIPVVKVWEARWRLNLWVASYTTLS